MSELYNLDGEIVEGAKTSEELEDLQFRSEERKRQREEEKEKNKVLQEELLKLTNKDFNFGKLKEQTKQKEKEIIKKEEEVEEAKKTFVEKQTDEYKQDALSVLEGLDEKEKEKVLHYYDNELKSKAITKNEIMEKMEKAYKLAIDPVKYNPINKAVNYVGRNIDNKNKSESNASKEIRQGVFKINNDNVKKYGSGWQPKF